MAFGARDLGPGLLSFPGRRPWSGGGGLVALPPDDRAAPAHARRPPERPAVLPLPGRAGRARAPADRARAARRAEDRRRGLPPARLARGEHVAPPQATPGRRPGRGREARP